MLHGHAIPIMNAYPVKALVLGLMFSQVARPRPRTPSDGRAAMANERAEERAVRDLQASAASVQDLDKPGKAGREALLLVFPPLIRACSTSQTSYRQHLLSHL